jgi:hypothetical protein
MHFNQKHSLGFNYLVAEPGICISRGEIKIIKYNDK